MLWLQQIVAQENIFLGNFLGKNPWELPWMKLLPPDFFFACFALRSFSFHETDGKEKKEVFFHPFLLIFVFGKTNPFGKTKTKEPLLV